MNMMTRHMQQQKGDRILMAYLGDRLSKNMQQEAVVRDAP